MSEWISVEDRLPDNTSEVLITDRYSYGIGWLRLSDNKWQAEFDHVEILGDGVGVIDMTVTHWQPLPAPPE